MYTVNCLFHTIASVYVNPADNVYIHGGIAVQTKAFV